MVAPDTEVALSEIHLITGIHTVYQSPEECISDYGLSFLNTYGIGIEINLHDTYDTSVADDTIVISPFQFGVSYSPHTNLIDIEKITITINGVILEDNEWKIESIISDDERFILMNVIENFKEQAQI